MHNAHANKSNIVLTTQTKKRGNQKLPLTKSSEGGARSHDLRIMNPTL